MIRRGWFRSDLLVVAAAVLLIHHHHYVVVVDAFSTGAGGCTGGEAAVEGLHLDTSNSRVVTSDTLNAGAVFVTIGGTTLDENAMNTFAIETDLMIGVESEDTPYKGVLVRLELPVGSTATATLTPGTGTQEASVCAAPILGITHTSAEDKFMATGMIRVDEAVENVMLDVTVVYTNVASSSYAFTRYPVSFRANNTTSPGTTSTPTASPVAGGGGNATSTPTTSPVGGGATPTTSAPTVAGGTNATLVPTVGGGANDTLAPTPTGTTSDTDAPTALTEAPVAAATEAPVAAETEAPTPEVTTDGGSGLPPPTGGSSPTALPTLETLGPTQEFTPQPTPTVLEETDRPTPGESPSPTMDEGNGGGGMGMGRGMGMMRRGKGGGGGRGMMTMMTMRMKRDMMRMSRLPMEDKRGKGGQLPVHKNLWYHRGMMKRDDAPPVPDPMDEESDSDDDDDDYDDSGGKGYYHLLTGKGWHTRRGNNA